MQFQNTYFPISSLLFQSFSFETMIYIPFPNFRHSHASFKIFLQYFCSNFVNIYFKLHHNNNTWEIKFDVLGCICLFIMIQVLHYQNEKCSPVYHVELIINLHNLSTTFRKSYYVPFLKSPLHS